MPDAERDDGRFSAAFLDDYFAECDEHLRAVRAALLRLDSGLNEGRLEAGALEQIFRGAHSIKGLSGMVELAEAETLAHELESYLRALRDGERALTREGIDTLVDGVMELERVIVARRDRAPIPAVDGLVSRVRALAAGQAVPVAVATPVSAAVAQRGLQPQQRAPDRAQVLVALREVVVEEGVAETAGIPLSVGHRRLRARAACVPRRPAWPARRAW